MGTPWKFRVARFYLGYRPFQKSSRIELEIERWIAKGTIFNKINYQERDQIEYFSSIYLSYQFSDYIDNK